MERGMISSNYTTIDANEPVSQLLGKLERAHEAIVLERGSFAGLFDPHMLLKSRVDVTELKVGNLVKAVPRLDAEDSHDAAAKAMYEADVHMLPVFEDGQLIGVVHAHDLLKRLGDRDVLKRIKVSNAMHKDPITLQVTDRIDTALSIMHDERIEHLPIVDEANKAIGFLSLKDVLTNYYTQHQETDLGQRGVSRTRAFRAEMPRYAGLPVSNIMNHGEVQTINAEQPLADAISKMAEHGIMSLLVADAGIPEAIITKQDILAAVLQQEATSPNVQYVGLEELDIDQFQKQNVKSIAEQHLHKIAYHVKNEYQVTLHIKEYNNGGKSDRRHKFSVHLRVTYPGATVPACQADSWNIMTAVQEAFKRLESHLSHQYKNSRTLHSERTRGREIDPAELKSASTADAAFRRA